MSRGEIRIGVRSGHAAPNGEKRLRIVYVNGGKRPLLWLGAGEREGLAWVAGLDTLRKIRDALNEAIP